jgi:hypothetical protein
MAKRKIEQRTDTTMAKRKVEQRTDTTMAKRKVEQRSNNDLQNTSQKTKDLTTQTLLKTGCELRCY